MRRGQTDGRALEHGDGLDRLGVVIEVDAGDGGPDVAGVHHEALGLEPADGLAHRNDARVDVTGDLLDHETGARA